MPLSAKRNLRYIQILLIIIIIVIVNMRAFSTLSSIVGAGRRTAEWAELCEEERQNHLKVLFWMKFLFACLPFFLFRMHDTWYFTTWKSHESKLIKKRGERREEKKIHRKREDIKRNENVFFSTSPAMPTFSSLSGCFFSMLCRSCSFFLLTTFFPTPLLCRCSTLCIHLLHISPPLAQRSSSMLLMLFAIIHSRQRRRVEKQHSSGSSGEIKFTKCMHS